MVASASGQFEHLLDQNKISEVLARCQSHWLAVEQPFLDDSASCAAVAALQVVFLPAAPAHRRPIRNGLRPSPQIARRRFHWRGHSGQQSLKLAWPLCNEAKPGQIRLIYEG